MSSRLPRSGMIGALALEVVLVFAASWIWIDRPGSGLAILLGSTVVLIGIKAAIIGKLKVASTAQTSSPIPGLAAGRKAILEPHGDLAGSSLFSTRRRPR